MTSTHIMEGGKTASGARKGLQTRVIVGFDDGQFGEVRAFAERRGVSFGEAVRLLCEWGIEADDGHFPRNQPERGAA